MDLTTLRESRYALAAAAAIFVAIALAAGAAGMFSSTGDRLGIRRIVSPAVTPEWQVGERFRMNTDGLRAVTVRPVVVGVPTGRVRFELRSLTPHAARVFRSVEVEASTLARSNAYRFAFDPIPDSRDAAYQLDVRSSPDAPSDGIALAATRGDGLRDGAMLINDRERWADLAFQTESTLGTLATVKAVTLLALIAAAWLAFVLLLREIIKGA